MASYVDRVLIKGEEVIYRANVSKWSLVPLLIIGVLTLAAYGLGILFFLWAWIIFATTELAVTNKRVIAKTGLIQRKTIEMFLAKVESIQVDQSILGRIFNYGSVIISGTGVHSAPFRSISDPLMFRKNFMSAADSIQSTTAGLAIPAAASKAA
jgi:uncharacterized membrane protein YdbT with pleckstrin-like domain